MRVRIYHDLNNLPSAFAALFAQAGRESFYATRAWFANLAETTLDPGASVRIYAVEDRSAPDPARGLVVLRAEEPAGIMAPRRLASLTNMYSMLFAPILAGDADAEAVLAAVARRIADERPRPDVVQLDTMDPSDPSFCALESALRRRGFIVQSFFQFGNWYEETEGLTIDAFMARRPSVLRNTVRRKERKLAKAHSVEFRLIDGADDLAAGIEAYESIYARSWKKPEPYPKFTPGLVRAAAALGALRLGVLTIDGAPAAAQIWLVHAGQATIYKLAYDERFKALSPGSILTRKIAERVLAHDRVREIDFGRGDDPYKGQWLAKRRERWGLIALNARTLRGAILALRHVGGRAAKRELARLGRLPISRSSKRAYRK